jgi:hypothetical protein
MPTRKQRRRRDKDFRHDVRVFEVDGEGNEVPIAELRAREEPKAKAKAAPAKGAKQRGTAKGGRALREPPQPSWNRALRRGGLMGAAMLIAFLFLFKNASLPLRIAWGVFYAVAFIPLTYWIDRTAYRGYLRRAAKQTAKR